MHRSRTKNNQKGLRLLIKKHQKTLGTLIIVSGVFLVFLAPVYRYYLEQSTVPIEPDVVEEMVNDHGPISAEESLLHEAITDRPLPTRVIIPGVGIDVGIRPARVVAGKWEVFEDSGSYGLGSGNPGQIGNMVLFAHARKDYFLNLRDVKVGASIYVFTDSMWYHYKVSETHEVSPTDISVIKPTEDETLTLYTCSGFADSKRMIVAAKLVK
jgi:LPXTG-site transpeptidase (sortase) family protein